MHKCEELTIHNLLFKTGTIHHYGLILKVYCIGREKSVRVRTIIDRIYNRSEIGQPIFPGLVSVGLGHFS